MIVFVFSFLLSEQNLQEKKINFNYTKNRTQILLLKKKDKLRKKIRIKRKAFKNDKSIVYFYLMFLCEIQIGRKM